MKFCHGRPIADLDAIEGIKALEETVVAFKDEILLTAMVPALDKVDPDDSFSSVPYEKGSALLELLEQKLGGPGKLIVLVHVLTKNYLTLCVRSCLG